MNIVVTWGDGRELSDNAIEDLCDGDADKKVIEMRQHVMIRGRA